MLDYSYDRYCADIDADGLEATWNRILRYVLDHGETEFLTAANFGLLYEAGLSRVNPSAKRRCGQFYTPSDVARVMAEWFDRIADGDVREVVCDVACGTGNLVLAYLDFIGRERATDLLLSGRVHLYDCDSLALSICVASILVRYGCFLQPCINVHPVDFLDSGVALPPRAKVLSNPPYGRIVAVPPTWRRTNVVTETHDLYAAFMEKILLEADGAVLVTPHSFIGGARFLPIRRLMSKSRVGGCATNGFVVSFDNIPTSVFGGARNHFLANENPVAVRAAITVVENRRNEGCGFRLSPLIRFRAAERERMFNCAVLESMLGAERQTVTKTNTRFAKVDNRLESVFSVWRQCSKVFGEMLSVREDAPYRLFVPTVCRYFTAATVRPLDRHGVHVLRFDDETSLDYAYCLFNSSFAYWFWCVYDGGITYPLSLLREMPIFLDRASAEDRAFFHDMRMKMSAMEGDCIVRKRNVGVQENVRFPTDCRDALNRRLLAVLMPSLGGGAQDAACLFDCLHANSTLSGKTLTLEKESENTPLTWRKEK